MPLVQKGGGGYDESVFSKSFDWQDASPAEGDLQYWVRVETRRWLAEVTATNLLKV